MLGIFALAGMIATPIIGGKMIKKILPTILLIL